MNLALFLIMQTYRELRTAFTVTATNVQEAFKLKAAGSENQEKRREKGKEVAM